MAKKKKATIGTEATERKTAGGTDRARGTGAGPGPEIDGGRGIADRARGTEGMIDHHTPKIRTRIVVTIGSTTMATNMIVMHPAPRRNRQVSH
jgi:hypothetical protein